MSEQHSLAFSVGVKELDRDPKSFTIEATEAELEDVAKRLDLLSVESLSGVVSVRDAGAEQGIMLHGSVKARFTQHCIVTLQPVPEELDTEFDLTLVDPEMADRMDEEGVYLDASAPDYDALEGDTVPLGEILVQTLSISMNPYPRAEGAELTAGPNAAVSVNEPELERPNPFAVLAKTTKES